MSFGGTLSRTIRPSRGVQGGTGCNASMAQVHSDLTTMGNGNSRGLGLGAAAEAVRPKRLVSVVIPTHNRDALLKEALDSVYAQKGADELFELEVIVVDDASSDSTPEVVSRYPTARYLRLPAHKGPAVARNAGIAQSEGSYVAFLDDDDVWLPEKLSLQVPVLEANPQACMVYSWMRDEAEVVPDPPSAPSGMVFRRLLMGNFCGNPDGVLLRRPALDAVGGFDESLSCAEDYDLWLRLAARFPFTFVPATVGVLRRSPRGHYATGIADGSRVRTRRAIIEKALASLPDDAASQAIRWRARLACGINLIEHRPVYSAELIHPLVMTTLREFPAIVDTPAGREAVAWRVREFAVASPDPLIAAQSFCKDLTMVAAKDRAIRRRFQVRRMVARAWTEVAVGLLKAPRPSRNAAAYALTLSILLDPSQALQKLFALWRRA